MATLKEQLASMPDIMEKEIKVLNGRVTVKIRRFTVKERDELLAEYKDVKDGDIKKGSELNSKITAAGMVESLSVDEVQNLPAIAVQEIAKAIMDFNGWTKEGQAALTDQFRASNGPPIQVPVGSGAA